MNSRERVLAALNHTSPDRTPRDLGGTTATGINPKAYCALQRYLGKSDGFEYLSARAQLARVDQDIVARFGIDLLPLIPASAGHPPELDEHRAYVDQWGIERRLPEKDGHYYVSRPPLATAERISDLSAYAWPAPCLDYSELGEQAYQLRANSDKALVLNPEVGFMHQTQFLRGFERWLMDLVADPTFAMAMMDRVIEIWIADVQAMIRAVNGNADVILYADDIGIQGGPMVSPRTFALLRPRLERVFGVLKQSGMKVLYHTCGNVESLIGEFIDMGVDALNPVQVSTKGMSNTAQLKQKWGDRMVFWGGIDTQQVLPRGRPEEVRSEVRRRLDDLARDGGYVLAAVHDVQPEVPPENLCAMFAAADEWESEQAKRRHGDVPVQAGLGR